MESNVRLTAVIITYALAFAFIVLGLEHINGNIGITPWIAVPLAFITALAPAFMYEHLLDELEEELDDAEFDCDLNLARLHDNRAFVKEIAALEDGFRE